MTFAKRLFATIKQFLFNHKKKLIGLLLLGLVAYYLKRRMTLNHLVVIVDKVLSFAQYLPLPDPPTYRPVHPIPKAEPVTYSCLKTFMNLDDIKPRIKNKEAGQWDRLKLNVLAGYTFSISLFDVTQLLNVVEAKYLEEFRSMDAVEPFQRAIGLVEENFRLNLSLYFEFVQTTIGQMAASIDITKQYSKEEIADELTRLMEGMFKELFSVSISKSRKSRSLVSEEVQRLFYTHFERKPAVRPTLLRRIWNGVGSMLTFESKEREFDISSQRFRSVKEMYALEHSLGNRMVMLFELNSQAQELFDLVFREFEDLLESVSFHSLVYYHSQYQANRFINRLQLYMIQKKQEKIKMTTCLSVIYKIIVEEYLPEDSWNHNTEFLSNEIKEALKLLHSTKDRPEAEDVDCRRNNILLNELIMEKRIQFAKNEFLLKYYHERSGIDATRDPGDNMDFQAKELLAFLSKQKPEE